ncbi:MAG: hypothetical protein JO175_01610, partial [Candidatus Eremiobacteraeota bacterium]|nr:hypothetical protein [Candidatus Eremiobacteraeota bacterium]
ALFLAIRPLTGQCDPAAPPTPSPPSTTVSAEDELSPNYQSETGSSNVVNLRAQIPYDNSSWVVRVKLPIVTAAPSESVTGGGDLAIWDLKVINAGQGQWLLGATFRFPTARDSLGTNKYSIGPSAGYLVQRGPLTIGYFANSFFSVIGPASYPGVAKTQIAPTVKYDLPGGWSVGLSTMQFTYDWIRNRWTDVPLGFRIGKKPLWMSSLDAYLEAERNLARTPDTPGWTVRALVRWKIAGPQNPSSDEDDGQ